jgi:hypothetical protein
VSADSQASDPIGDRSHRNTVVATPWMNFFNTENSHAIDQRLLDFVCRFRGMFYGRRARLNK